MLIESGSKYLLKQTRSKAKMYEYDIPLERHIFVEPNADELLIISIAAIGNISAEILNEKNPYRIIPIEKKSELEFASRYFDAFFHSHLEPKYDQYYLLLGAIAYYYCDYIGSSKVMASMINRDEFNLNCGGLDKLLILLLCDEMDCEKYSLSFQGSPYENYLLSITELYRSFFHNFEEVDKKIIDDFRLFVYSHGTSRELLITDALLAILLVKMERSAINLLPAYSKLSKNDWKSMLENQKNIRELWPAQIHLGEAGIFSGTSGVIQMPTSSGKTTSMSIAIRSAFISNRTSLAIIVAPFRALCHEISSDIINDFIDDSNVSINEFSDILEMDEILEMYKSFGKENQSIIVLTPEKLIYLLRQSPEIIKQIGIIIFDEGHMFDDYSRGAQYELLISTIMMYLEKNTQRLLISAVIPNSKEINAWFTNNEGIVIADNSIRATEKSIAIVDWERTNGYLYFLDPENRNELEFYVPRVIERSKLNKLGKERRERFFPEVNFSTLKVENNDIAIYLAIKLNHNGGVAIFCGRKNTVDKVLERILEIEQRGKDISSFRKNVVNDEDKKIAFLIKQNYGKDNIYYAAALKGVFPHHRGISNGIRIAIEFAMKENLIRCLVCTSTLAQGVNLPIRYLIISSLYQAQEKIRVRDFHNLIGRAGRAGKYTEGTILLSESFVYSKRRMPKKNWRWKGYLEMLDSENSESCLSQFILLVRPISYGNIQYDFYKLVKMRYEYPEKFEEFLATSKQRFEKDNPKNLDKLVSSVEQINRSLDAIESYLLSFLDHDNDDQLIVHLVSKTFCYYLANENEKERMKELFSIIKNYLVREVRDVQKRAIFGRTLLGTKQLILLEKWTRENLEVLLSCKTSLEILCIILPKLVEYSDKKVLKAVVSADAIFNIAAMWIDGLSYEKINEYADQKEILIVRRCQEVKIKLTEIIDICDNGFGYDSTLIINSISELLRYNSEKSGNLCILLDSLSRQMKYGLPTKESIKAYEVGFSDRVVAQHLASMLQDEEIKSKEQFNKMLKSNNEAILKFLKKYPTVFSEKIKML